MTTPAPGGEPDLEPDLDVDVLVAGGGPAGCAAALTLAGSGVRTALVERHPGGADPAPRQVLVASRATIRALEALGVGADLPAAHGMELVFGPHVRHRLPEGEIVPVPAHQLRRRLREATARAGVIALTGEVVATTGVDGRHRVSVRTGTGGRHVVARHVVVATGTAQAPAATGIVCVQPVAGVPAGADVALHVVAPSAEPADGATPTSVWVVPAPRPAVIAVALTGGATAAPADVTAAALRLLAGHEPAFGRARAVGPPTAGPMDSGFTPDRAVHEGRLLVGDAAGLTNPFTGEGLSYALESGVLAARCILDHLDRPRHAADAYRRRLAAHFVGYFETARHARRRYHLVWRILEASSRSTSPFLAKTRRTVLLSDGMLGADRDRLRLTRPDLLALEPVLAACDEIMVATVRRDWPFIARIAVAGDRGSRGRPRPATLFYSAMGAAGTQPDVAHAPVAAAIELATLGSLAFGGPFTDETPPRGVDWEAAATIVAGDFLLAHAARLVSQAAPDLSWSFADWLGEIAALRAEGAADPGGRRRDAAHRLFGSLFEFPARMGALAAGREDRVAGLREIGYQIGVAFLLAEDLLALDGRRTRLDASLEAMLAGGLSGLPALLGPADLTAAALAADPGRARDAVTTALSATTQALDSLIEKLPQETGRRLLRSFVATLATDVIPGRNGVPAFP
jgi:flavin-dependent dehydrogenase/geranylgeranyl pyrophosphate synthase